MNLDEILTFGWWAASALRGLIVSLAVILTAGLVVLAYDGVRWLYQEAEERYYRWRLLDPERQAQLVDRWREQAEEGDVPSQEFIDFWRSIGGHRRYPVVMAFLDSFDPGGGGE